jgi:tetratricopeptide (TPR) repeat protein
MKVQTNNIGAMISFGAMKMRLNDPAAAVPYFDRALALSPQNLSALMNRAIANLQLGNLDAAQRDYEAIVDLLPKPPYAVYYGLGEIHLQKKNARQAIKNYTEYLKLVPITSPEARLVQEKIKRLKSGSF